MKNYLLLYVFVCVATISSIAQNTNQKSSELQKSNVVLEVVKYEENDKEEEINIDGKDIYIIGNNNRLTITGNVNKILITGKDNDITIVAVDKITITGSGNFVSWEKTNTTNKKPIIQDNGGYNNVAKRSGNAQTKEEN